MQRTNELLKKRSPIVPPSLADNSPDEKAAAASPSAVLVGLDGWHLTRAQLDAFPDPKMAHDRRGIHWTFDGPGYVSFVKALRRPFSHVSAPVITAPSFDHALKDPSPDAVTIHPDHRIVVIEGLYTFLSIDPWAEAGKMLDERWFVALDIEEASRRLVKRHVATGVANDIKEAIWRAEENDMPSMLISYSFLSTVSFVLTLSVPGDGRFVMANMLEPTRTIQSVDDQVFALE